MRSLSAPVRRFAALGVLLLVVLFAYVGVAQPLLDSYAASRAESATLRAAIVKAAAARAKLGDLKQQLAQLEQQARGANGFLPTTTDALAGAALQAFVKGAVDKVHGELRSTQILASQTEGSARRVSVRAQFSADLAGVQRVFYDLETMPSILFLNNVQITRQQAPAAASAASRRAAAEALLVQFDLVGYMRNPG